MRKWMYLTLLALTAAAPAKQTTVNTIGAPNSAEAIKLIDQPCNGQPSHDRASAVCAQWVAADAGQAAASAGRQSADYAMWSVIFAAATVVGLTGTLGLTIRANKIARQTSERQLRAYVAIRPVTLLTFEDSKSVRVRLSMRNGGATPAYECAHAGNVVALDPDAAASNIASGSNRTHLGIRSSFSLPSQAEFEGEISGSYELSQTDRMELISGLKRLYTFGFVEYTDTFGTLRKSEFCFSADPTIFKASLPYDQPTPLIWHLEAFHNKST